MKNVVAYVRVSTDNQAKEDRFGIDEQKNIIMKYCSENDMQVSEWYIDKGESGSKESRPELDRLLYGELRNPPVESVIVAKSDRIARDIKLYFYYMMLLEKKSISLISATEEVVNDETGLGNVYKSLMMFVAEQERANITRRTSGGRRQKANAGGYSGGASPYGYRAVGGKLEIDPKQAEVVRVIYELRDSGKTMRDISDTLNEKGYKTSRGSIFRPSTLQVILGNEKTYKGFYRYGKNNDVWVKGEHEAIL